MLEVDRAVALAIFVSLAPLSLRAQEFPKGNSTLVGRATLRGVPVEDAKLTLYSDTLEEFELPRDADDASLYWCSYGAFDPWWIAPAHRRPFGAQGFRITRLAAGEYRLEIESSLGARRVWDPLIVPDEGVLQLGDVELEPAGRIEGRVVLANGQSAAGCTIRTTFLGQRSRTAVIDHQGRFTFEHLPPAFHRLQLEPTEGSACPEAWRSARVGSDRTTVVEFDLRKPDGCDLDLTVFVNGAPADSVTVTLHPVEVGSFRCALGPTDAFGRALGLCSALGEVRATVVSPAGWRIGSTTLAPPLAQHRTEVRRIELSATRLLVRYPPAEQRLARVEVSGTPNATLGGSPFRVSTRVARAPATKDKTCDVGFIEHGTYELFIRLYDLDGALRVFRKKIGAHEARLEVELSAADRIPAR